jgi:carnitine O-acetyltransferase
LYALYSVWQRCDNADGAKADAASGVDDVTRSESDEPHSLLSPLSSLSPQSLHRRHRKRYATAARQLLPLLVPFADAGWPKLNTTILSMSDCGNLALHRIGLCPRRQTALVSAT